MKSESEIRDLLKQARISLGPLRLDLVSEPEKMAADVRLDAAVEISWNNSRERFAVELKALSTPKIVREAIYTAKANARNASMNPMIIVPYLSREAVAVLEREGVSGVDLCGNGIVTVPGKWYIERSGQPNLFPSSSSIKGIYARGSSLVGRTLLVRPRYQRVGDVVREIAQRDTLAGWHGRSLSFSTVSKVLKALEDDLVVGRDGASIQLLQPEKLLDRLSVNYKPPRVQETIHWRILPSNAEPAAVGDALTGAFRSEIPAVVTGLSSVAMYALMQRGETISIYCPDPEAWLTNVPGEKVERFANISLARTDDAFAYLDARAERGILWASPVQTYLELMNGDKRDQETALQIRDLILKTLREGRK